MGLVIDWLSCVKTWLKLNYVVILVKLVKDEDGWFGL